EVEVQLMIGQLLRLTNKTKEAEEILHRAVTGADAVGDDRRRAQSWTELALVVGDPEARSDEGLRLAREAGAVVERLGNPPELDSELRHVLGTIFLRQGKFEEARRHLKQALDVRQKALGSEHPEVARTLNTLGIALKESGQYEESLGYLQKALQISES